MSTENQQTKDPSQEEERFWTDFDRQYFTPPHPSLVLCLKNHIWHTKHISSIVSKHLSSKTGVKKNLKKKNSLYLRSVKFPLRLSINDRTVFNTFNAPANNGIFRYFNAAASLSNDQFQGLLENDNVFKPLVSPKHDASQKLPTIYSSSLPDAIHLTLYIPKVIPRSDVKKSQEKDKENPPNKDKTSDKMDEEEAINNFVDSFKSSQLLKNYEVPQILSGPNPTWFAKGKGRFKKGVELGPKYKKCDKLVKNPHGLLSDPVWQHFNTNYAIVPPNANSHLFSYTGKMAKQEKNKVKSEDSEEIREGTDLLNYHSMCDLVSCRVDYSPLLFTFVSSKKSLLCKRCLGFPRLFCNLCKHLKGTSTALFSSQYISEEKYHMTYNLIDLFKLRSNSDDFVQSYYVNPYKYLSKDQPTFTISTKEEAKNSEEEDDKNLIYNYIQTLESLNTVFNNLLNRIANEYKPDTSRWNEIESKMLDTYIEQYNNKTLDNRYTYSVQKQSIDVLQLRLKVKKSSELPASWTDRALCSICGTDEDWDDDPILFCDCCFIPMHFCCLGYKPGTLNEVKQKMNVSKFQRLNFYNHLTVNVERPVKKIKLEKLDDLVDMDEDEWYCPVCTYLMEQLGFLDENLVMAIIRNVAGPKNSQHLQLIQQCSSSSTHKASEKDQGPDGAKSDQENKEKGGNKDKKATEKDKDDKSFLFNRPLPYIMGFDYDNPLERSYITVHPTTHSQLQNLTKLNQTTGESLSSEKEFSNETEERLENVSILNLYDHKKEFVTFNTNGITEPKNFCKLLLSRKGLYFENNFWLLLSRANVTAIHEYLNYYTYEEIYLSRLIQQDKLIQSTKQLTKKRSNSITSKVSTSRSLSLSSNKEFVSVKTKEDDQAAIKARKKETEVQVKKEPEQGQHSEEDNMNKKGEIKYISSNMHCKNPLKKMYVSLNLKLLSDFVSHGNCNTEKVPSNKETVMKEQIERKEFSDVDVVVKLPMCIFCGFDAFIPGGGPMKRTTNSGTWGHIKCALANDCTIESDEINYGTFVPKIKALKCIFCGNWSTSVIQCSYGNCCKAFHVPCSSASPSCLFTWDTNGKPDVLCPIHSKGLAPTSLLRKLQLRLNAGKNREKDLGKTKDREKGPMRYKEKESFKDNKDRDVGQKKSARDSIDNICVNENLYLNHFLRPNYSNISTLLEMLLNENAGTLFKSNLSSNYYEAEQYLRYNSVDSSFMSTNVNSSRSATSKCSNSDEFSSNEDDMNVFKDSDKEDDEYIPDLLTPQSTVQTSNTTSSRFTNSKSNRQNTPRALNASSSVIKLTQSGRTTPKSSMSEDPLTEKESSVDPENSVLSSSRDELSEKDFSRKNSLRGKCPMNNVDKNNCFWCCLGFDLKNHNRHVFDDKTPSSKIILSILYNNNHDNVNTIKSIINSKFFDSTETDDLAHTPMNLLNSKSGENGGASRKSGKMKRSESNGKEKEEFKVPWSVLSNIIMDRIVDEKMNIYINGDLVNNNKLVKKNDFLVHKLSSEALVRLFNTFEPDSSKFVVNTLFTLLNHIDFIHSIDELYGYNNIYFSVQSNSMDGYLDSDRPMEKRLPLGMTTPGTSGVVNKMNTVGPISDDNKGTVPISGPNLPDSFKPTKTESNMTSKEQEKKTQDQNLLSFIQSTAGSTTLNFTDTLSKVTPFIRDIFNKGSKDKDKKEQKGNDGGKETNVPNKPEQVKSESDKQKENLMEKIEKDRQDKRVLKEKVYKLLKEVNQVEIIKMEKSLLPNSILRKYINNKKITICKVCLEFKYIENDIDNNKRKRNIYNESYRKCFHCSVEVCNSCLSVTKSDFENLTGSSALIVGDYIGEEIDDFYFSCVRCKEFSDNLQIPLLNCVLCSRFDGLLLKINSKLLSFAPSRTSCWNNYSYVHLICLEWLYWSKNVNTNSKKLNRSLFEQNCNYCGMLTGATITCSNTCCLSKFHPSCAGKLIYMRFINQFIAFLGCKIDVGKKNENMIGVKRALCLRHTLISICRTSLSERKFMVAPCYLYEVLINNNYFSTFFKAVYLSPNCINNRAKLTSRFKIKKRVKNLDYKNNLSVVKMASYINYGLIINKTPQIYDLTISESIARDRLIQGMNYIFYQQKSPQNNFFNQSNRDHETRENNMRDIKHIISLIKNGLLKPIQGSKRGRKPKSLDGSDVDKRHKMSMEEILRYGHTGVLENGEYYCPVCFSFYFENSPGLPGDDLHWIGCDKCERWFHFVCAGVWVDYRDKDSWYCYHCSNES